MNITRESHDIRFVRVLVKFPRYGALAEKNCASVGLFSSSKSHFIKSAV